METIKIICCAAGKSGGHIIPNINWALQHHSKEHILFFSGDTALDHRILNNRSEINWHIPLHTPSPRRWYYLPLAAGALALATLKSFYYLIKHRPSMILSTGGIVAVPVCIAGWILRIPIKLFELNATPGSATRWLAPLATTIHVCFKKTKSYFPEKKVAESEYPVQNFSKIQSEAIFADSDRFTIFIQGGSQGSEFLNKKVKALIEEKSELIRKINIIHQTGTTDFDWKAFYHDHGILAHVFAFEDNLAPYYQSADLIICRSGAGQLFEAVYFQKPCITVPLEISGNNHQLDNARSIAEEHSDQFMVIRQKELDSMALIAAIRKLIPKSQLHQDQSAEQAGQIFH